MKAGSTPSPPDNPSQPKEAAVYADLCGKAHGEGLKAIRTELLLTPNEQNDRLAIVKATVEVERVTLKASAMPIPARSRTPAIPDGAASSVQRLDAPPRRGPRGDR